MAPAAVEHVAPGEEQVVFSRTAGVVASKVSYMGVLDDANDWQVLESPHEDEAPPLACQFNHRGTHFAVGDEVGRVDLWSSVPIRMFVKSLDLTLDILDRLAPPAGFTESANGRGQAALAKDKDKDRDDIDHGWSTAAVHWSRCSRYVVAAYVQKRKTWPDGGEVLLPGLVVLWSVVDAQVEGYLRLSSRVAHVSLSPKDPRTGSVSCADGTSFIAVFPTAPPVAAPAAEQPSAKHAAPREEAEGEPQLGEGEARGEGGEGGVESGAPAAGGWGGGGEGGLSLNGGRAGGAGGAGDKGEGVPGDVMDVGGCSDSHGGGVDGGGGDGTGSDGPRPATATAEATAPAQTGTAGGAPKPAAPAAPPLVPGPTATATAAPATPAIAAASTTQVPAPAPTAGAAVSVVADNNNNGSPRRSKGSNHARAAELLKLWDPTRQLDLFSTTGPSSTPNDAGAGESPGTSPEPGNTNGSSGIGTSTNGAEGKAGGKVPLQPCRVAWGSDGETLFLLNHEGSLLKVKASFDGARSLSLSLLARADPNGGASPAILQLSPDGEKALITTATKGLCLVPTDDLDLARAQMFGETLGMRGAKTRFWGAAALGDIHGRGSDGSGKKRLTIVGNPSKTRDDKTDIFFFDVDDLGGQPRRVDTPRREGVITLVCSPRSPLLMFLCPTGEMYFREEVLKTDFPGPWYPSGYVLIDNNVDYLEAEDQLDTVIMTSPDGEVLSKTQAHEVVVPWQHEAVAVEGAGGSVGTNEDPVDVEGGEATELWADPCPHELRWIPEGEDDDSWASDEGDEEGSGGPRGSPRGVQESLGGPLARLLGATPPLLKEARKRFRVAGASDRDTVEKRRRMVPKMLEVLAVKKKKYDEEAIKRKRKQEETRARNKRNREKKADTGGVRWGLCLAVALEGSGGKGSAWFFFCFFLFDIGSRVSPPFTVVLGDEAAIAAAQAAATAAAASAAHVSRGFHASGGLSAKGGRGWRRLMMMRQPPSSLSEAPALGAWRPRPSRGGVALHARWPFWRRGRDAEKVEGERDTAQQTLAEQTIPAAVPPTDAGGGAQGGEGLATAAGAAAADATTTDAAVQSQGSESVAIAPDSNGGPSPQSRDEVETIAAAAAAPAAAAAASGTGDSKAAAAAATASASGSAEAQELQNRVGTIEDPQRKAATAVGAVSRAGAGAGAGAGGGARVADSRGRKAAARAAVAVIERMQDEARRKERGATDSFRQKPRTTRDEMFNICTKQANLTESEGARAVQTFLYALGSGPLISVAEQEELIEKIEERATSSTPLTWTYDSEWIDSVPSIYDDELLRDIGARSPLVAREIDAVLRSDPMSTKFSELLLEYFTMWAAPLAPDAGALEKLFSGRRKFNAQDAFEQVNSLLSSALIVGAETKNLGTQFQANQIGDEAFRAMGNPKGNLVVEEADVSRFVQEIIPSFATLREEDHALASCGVRLVPCRLLEFTTPADAAREMKATLRETGLDKKLTAFLTIEGGLLKYFMELNEEVTRMEEKMGVDSEVNDALLTSFAQDQVSGIFSEKTAEDLSGRNLVVILVPAGTKPSDDTLLGGQGRTALALGAPITLCAFLGDAFNGSPVEIASKTVDGDIQLLTQVGVLGATMIGLLLARDLARFAAAKKAGVELAKPLALPSFDTGVLARRISFASYPANSEDLFDIVLAGPLVGLAASVAALLVGLQMTAAAGAEALAGFPSLPSSLLQGSSFVGSLVDNFLHTNLGAQDLAADRIAMHPLAVGGAVAMLWNAATVLPLRGSDGKTAIDTLNNTVPAAAVANFLAVAFVALQYIGGGGDFLFSVLAVSIVANPDAVTPIIREDNVTPVRSPLRLVLAFLVACLAVVVLTPMTVSPFLTGGGLSVDPGAGAESVAAGLGVGGIGFGGFL
eukprot:g16615.t1